MNTASTLNAKGKTLHRQSKARSARPSRQLPLKRSKVSRACDACKIRRGKCSGTAPCTHCEKRHHPCRWTASYGRGRPPTPPLADWRDPIATPSLLTEEIADDAIDGGNQPASEASPTEKGSQSVTDADCHIVHAAASPGLGVTDTQGQYFDHSSSLSFLHRASARLRLSARNDTVRSGGGEAMLAKDLQVQHCAGDFALEVDSRRQPLVFPDRSISTELVNYYFDICVVTYRFLHRPTIESWLDQVHRNVDTAMPLDADLGEMRTAVVLLVLAVAMFHRGIARQSVSEEDSLFLTRRSHVFFHVATSLIDSATGYPSLESVQARLVQILFLLHSSRMNQAWYAFGTVIQCISALGLHRRSRVAGIRRDGADYVLRQCGRRCFWVAYVLDIYLSVMFGRPRHYHDGDLDQELPDRVDDENMTAKYARTSSESRDSEIDSLIHHIKVAAIVGKISSRIYPVNPAEDDSGSNHTDEISRMLTQWKENLPKIYNDVNPSSLVPPFQRQAVALKLAHSHALMYAFRPLLLGSNARENLPEKHLIPISQCLCAAQSVLEMVAGLAEDGSLYHAFWWTRYVTFVALSVAYGWQIRQQSPCFSNTIRLHPAIKTLTEEIPALASRCQKLVQHSGQNFMSKRYTIILEELQQELQRRACNTLDMSDQLNETIKSTSRHNPPRVILGNSANRRFRIPSEIRIDLPSYHVGLQEGCATDGVPELSSAFLPSHRLGLTAVDGGIPIDEASIGADTTEGPYTIGCWSDMNWLDLDSLAMGTLPDFEIYPDLTMG